MESSEEALQQTFYRVHKWRHKYSPKYQVAQWIFIIAKSEINRMSQKSSKVSFLEEATSMELLSQNDLEASISFREQLAQTQSELSEEETQLLHMRFIDGLAFEEMAEELDLNPSNLRKKVSRLLKKLREKRGLNEKPS